MQTRSNKTILATRAQQGNSRGKGGNGAAFLEIKAQKNHNKSILNIRVYKSAMNQRDIRRSLRPLPNSTQQTEPVRKARQNYHARRPQTNAILGRRWRKTSQRKKCEGKPSIKQQVGELQTTRPTARRRKIHAASQDLSRPSTATSYTSIWQEIQQDHEGQEKVRADSQCLLF